MCTFSEAYPGVPAEAFDVLPPLSFHPSGGTMYCDLLPPGEQFRLWFYTAGKKSPATAEFAAYGRRKFKMPIATADDVQTAYTRALQCKHELESKATKELSDRVLGKVLENPKWAGIF